MYEAHAIQLPARHRVGVGGERLASQLRPWPSGRTLEVLYKRVRPREGKPDLVTYEARWREPDGRQRKRTFRKKSDADRYLTSIESSLLTGGYVDPSRSRVTVGNYAEQWMAGRTRLKPRTVASYRSLLSNRVLPRWADVRLDRITYEDVTAWVSDMASTDSPSTTRQGYTC